MIEKIDELKQMIDESKTIALFAHINPDGDAIGSILAMKTYLDSLGKDTYVFLQEPISQNYRFSGIHDVANKRQLSEYDLAFCLDCPHTKRFGEWEQEFYKAKRTIKIDHHIAEEKVADLEFIDTEICSVCEFIYKIFKQMGVKITPKIATYLYNGIATDTGGFLHGNHGEVTADTWKAVADLVECGADLETVNYNIFIKTTKNVFELNKEVLQRVEFYADGKIAMVCLPNSVLQETGTDLYDTHKFLDDFTGIEGVEILAFMTQVKDNENAVSIRSRTKNAQRICKHFGGGGHLRASGCRIFVPLQVAKSLLLEECKKELYRND